MSDAVNPIVPPDEVKKDADEVAAAIVNLNKAIAHKYGPGAKRAHAVTQPVVKWFWIAFVTASCLGFHGCSMPSLPDAPNVGGWWTTISAWLHPINPFVSKDFSGPVPDGSDEMLKLLNQYGKGAKILIVFDSSKKLTPGQDSAMHAAAVIDWINANAAMGPDGKTREFREFGSNVNLANEAAQWQTYMAKPRASLPWVYIWK